ncbi:DUF4256 domain-containing protein [Eubacterium sp. 1001713B170207_170306_E7]|uniref:DUF4256 domain-containing protein n=1 Tax=Eubacterium sp. 1001713B170207_170306_E7 TaxID=2787097 RepID=UPI00189B80A2|nr:DUF4256 domain-containing protein [Eubacterium sp. 1001713B170207_170306_E7]
MTHLKKTLTPEQAKKLFNILQERFIKNMDRHKNLEWEKLRIKLEEHPEKLWSLNAMEETGGEPDVLGYDHETGRYIFYDCSEESPAGRRKLCYDQEALESRKANKPADSAVAAAAAMGIELLTEAQYAALQQKGAFDTKTSSWILTPAEIRKRGGALFCDRRYDHVFVYHNGAESYYAARGFRGRLTV